MALGGAFAGPDGRGRTGVLASSSIDNASGSSSTLNAGVLGVDLAGASARPDGKERNQDSQNKTILYKTKNVENDEKKQTKHESKTASNVESTKEKNFGGTTWKSWSFT